MRFADIAGNEAVKAALKGMVDSGRIPHAIMFHEDDGGGAVGLCLALLQYLGCSCRPAAGGAPADDGGLFGGAPADDDGLFGDASENLFGGPDEAPAPAPEPAPALEDSCGQCPWCNKISKLIHPDVHFVFPVTGGSIIPSSAKPTSLSYVKQWRELVLSNPCFTEQDLDEALGIEGKSALIAVGDAKEILGSLAFNSLEGGWRSVVVYLPEKMNQDAANRLLKSIEEPPERTLFLLVTHAPEKVLPTIASRCQCIRVGRASRVVVTPDQAEMRELFVPLMDAILARDLLAALETGEAVAALPSRDKIKSFLRYASSMMRNLFLVQQGLRSVTGAPEEDLEAVNAWASKLKKSYARTILPHVDRSLMLIERNVNAKIVVCDLVNKMFMI